MTTDKNEAAKPDKNASRFLIYETEDAGRTLRLVGEETADQSAAAARLYFAGLPDDRQGDFVAVSEGSFKIRQRAVETTTKVTVRELGAPKFKPDAPVTAPSVLEPQDFDPTYIPNGDRDDPLATSELDAEGAVA